MRKFLGIFVTAALALGLATFAACGDDDDGEVSEEDRAAVEAAVLAFLNSGPENVDAFLAATSDDVLEGFLGVNREDCAAAPDQCLQGPIAENPTVTVADVSGDDATSNTSVEFGDIEITLTNEDDTWVVTRVTAVTGEVPGGVPAVDLTLNEFAFGFNAADIPADGNFAFLTENAGDQYHEVILQKIPEDLDIEAALQSGEQPEVENVAFVVPIAPDASANVVLDSPLGPGRYGLLCFFPNVDSDEGVPHAVEGMWADFTIGE